MTDPKTPDLHVEDSVESARSKVQWGGGIMMASIIASRILAILRDTAMSAKFGWGIHTDAYRISFTIPDLIYYGVAGGAFSSAFIPVFNEFIAKKEDKKAWELFNVIMTVVFLLVLAIIVVAWIYTPALATFMSEGAKAKAHPEMVPWIITMSRILLPAQIAFFVGGIMFGVLYTKGHFVIPGLSANIYNIGIIIGAVLISYFVSPGIVGMTIGATIGAFIGSLVIPYWALHKMGVRFRPSLNLRAEGVKKVFVLMLPVVLGLSLPGVYATIMQKFASYDEASVNTVIELSNRIMQAPLGIFGASLALAAFPVLSQFAAQNRFDYFTNQLNRSMKTVLFLSVPAAAIMLAMAPQIIQVFYGYGKAASEDPETLIICVRLFAFGVPAWCLHPLLMRAYFARQMSLKPIILGTITTAAFIFMIIGLRHVGLGYKSMPIAGSVAAIGLVFVLLGCVKAEIKEMRVLPLLETFLKSCVAATIAGSIAFVMSFLLPARLHKVPLLFGFLFIMLFCVFIYTTIGRWMKMEEVETVDKGMARFKERFSRNRITN